MVVSVRYSERLDDNEIVASVGSKGDSHVNAMAESFNGRYKWELMYPKGPRRGIDDVVAAICLGVSFNRRLARSLDQQMFVGKLPVALEPAYKTA